MTAFENSYWNGKGTHKELADALRKLIPMSGPVPNARKNPKLEKYRKACNVYYDLFNNGLCNRAAEFRHVFGFSPKHLYTRWQNGHLRIQFQDEEMNARMNATLDLIILAAAEEQGLLPSVAIKPSISA